MKSWIVVFGLAIAAAACGGGTRELPTSPGSATVNAPVIEAPANDAQVDTLRPTLIVRNVTSSESGAKTYEFQISDRSDFLSTIVSQSGIAEGSDGTTSFTPASDLQPATQLHWRARAAQGGSLSAWSATAQFRTKPGGYNRPGELFDPLTKGQTIGERVGSITDMGARGLRVDNPTSWVRYQLAETITSGEISVEVEGLQANGPGQKSRIFSMMDGGSNLFDSKFLFNVQYRGVSGNPDNAISYKLLMGHNDLKYEPTLSQRIAGARSLNPAATYLWTATWGTTFRLVIREGGASGPVIYDRSHSTPGTYNPSPHTVYLGANDAADESGSYAGAIYRNLWVGRGPRPSSLTTALTGR